MIKKILCLFAAALLVFNLAACSKQVNKEVDPSDKSTYSEIGTGARSFYLDIIFEEHEKHYKISTGQSNVGPALEELGLVEGHNGEYGLFIESVEGEKHVYEEDGKYWAFYEEGQYAVKSIDRTPIKNEALYALRVE